MVHRTYALRGLGIGGLVVLLILGGRQVHAADPSAESLTVAVVSPRCVFGDVQANLDHFTELLEEAAAKRARLICFPELALTSYSTHAEVLESAEEIPGPTTKRLEAIEESTRRRYPSPARQHGRQLGAGSRRMDPQQDGVLCPTSGAGTRAHPGE